MEKIYKCPNGHIIKRFAAFGVLVCFCGGVFEEMRHGHLEPHIHPEQSFEIRVLANSATSSASTSTTSTTSSSTTTTT